MESDEISPTIVILEHLQLICKCGAAICGLGTAAVAINYFLGRQSVDEVHKGLVPLGVFLGAYLIVSAVRLVVEFCRD